MTGTCRVPPERDRRGQGAQYKRNFLSGKPRPVGGELQSPLQIPRPYPRTKSEAPRAYGVALWLGDSVEMIPAEPTGDKQKVALFPNAFKLDPFDGAKSRLSRRGGKAPLRVNPEQAPAFMPASRRVDIDIWVC